MTYTFFTVEFDVTFEKDDKRYCFSERKYFNLQYTIFTGKPSKLMKGRCMMERQVIKANNSWIVPCKSHYKCMLPLSGGIRDG